MMAIRQPDSVAVETRNSYLEELGQWVFNALEIGHNLNDLYARLDDNKSDIDIFEEVMGQLKLLYGFSKIAFMVVDEDEHEFIMASCLPHDQKANLLEEIDAQIETDNYAWALGQTRACIVRSCLSSSTTVLHVLSTKSRIRGMFVGVLECHPSDVMEIYMRFLSMLLLGISNALESRELYRFVREHNRNLEKIVKHRTRELEDARIEAETANMAKSMFLATMSHEIRTPLTSIIGYAEWLQDEATSDREREEATRTILRSGRHLLQIINDILDISKIESQKIDIETMPVSLGSLLAEIKRLLSVQAQEKGLLFEIDCEFPLPKQLLTDPTRLKQILLNLCSNAIKFTGEGSVTVKVSYDSSMNMMNFEVCDTGIGIAPDKIESIFDSFTQADSTMTRCYGGSGLGLNISRRLAEILGGKIVVRSTPGEGSCFTLSVDAGQDSMRELVDTYASLSTACEKVPANSESGVQKKLSGKVLLAEDNQDNQRLVEFYLSKRGLKIDIVENGRQAVESALSGDFDLLLMDMQMPELDGVAATKLLRSTGYNTPIVTLTANAARQDRDRCLDAGCNDFLTKPFDKRRLDQVLDSYLQPADEAERGNSTMSDRMLENEQFAALIRKFLDMLPDKKNRIEDALKTQCWPELATLMHQLKGSAGTFGFPHLGEIAAQIEALIKRDEPHEVTMLMEEFNEEYQRIVSLR